MLALLFILSLPGPDSVWYEPWSVVSDGGQCSPGQVLCPDGAHCCNAETPVCCPSTQGCCPSGTRYSCWIGDGVRGCYATEEEAQARCPNVVGACE